MKIRTDFVTNSSSSSFVIAYKKIEHKDGDDSYNKLVDSYNKMVNLLMESTGQYSETEEARTFATKEDYDKHIIEDYGNKEIKTLDDIFSEYWFSPDDYGECIKYINDGYTIAEKRIDYSDDSLGRLIASFSKDNNDFVIIDSE